MKIRNGFVSNSSSSSFVVAFPEMPTSVEHVKKMMFGDDETFPNPYPNSRENSENYYDTIKIAETVFNDIQNQTVNDTKNIIEGFNGWLEGSPDYDYDYKNELTKEERDKRWNEYLEADRKFRDDTAKAFMKPRKDKFIYVFEYSDQDGDYGCTLEHGGIFDRLDHRRISRH